MNMNKRILITGANGFIGSFLCEEALKRGYQVIAAVRQSSDTRWIADRRINKEYINLNDPDLLTGDLRRIKDRYGKISYVVHNAGITIAPKFDDFVRINTLYTGNLLQAVKSAELLEGKFLFMSSVAAHGPGGKAPDSKIRETDDSKPISAYGKSKLAGEELVKNQSAFPWLILRPTAVYGPRDHDFLTFFRLIYRGTELYIGRGAQETSLIYVKDVIKAILAVLESTRENRTYFVGEKLYCAKDLYRTIKDALGVRRTLKIKIPIPLLLLSSWIASRVFMLFNRYTVFNPSKINELGRANWRMDTSRIKEELSFTPDFSLEEGIRETGEWYKKEGWLD
jgi:nucleoside-diphosphate-sugar epimerase